MTSKPRSQLHILLAFVGVLTLLATIALGAATVRPTEATWQDTVHGASTFGVANPNEGNQFARAISMFGFMDRASRDGNVGPVSANRQSPDKSRITRGPSTHQSSGALGFLPLNTVGYSCATLEAAGQPCSNSAVESVSDPVANAVSETQSLSLTTASIGWLDLVTYEYDNPIRAMATCSPVDGRASLGWGGPLILGRGSGQVPLSLPAPNAETFGKRSWGAYDYEATLQHVRTESRGYALSQLRLRIIATGTAGAERWSLNLILAHAECGVDQATPGEPDRPTPNNWVPLARQTNRISTVQADAPAALQPIVEQLDDELPEDAESIEDETDREVDADRDEDEANLPTLDDAADEKRTDDEETASDDATTTRVTSPSSTATATTPSTEPETSEPSTSATATDVSDPASSARTEPTPTETSNPTTSTEAPAGPQRPQDVRVGRKFSVVTREGVELGAARIEDITRTPDCGVEITLEITTSAEDGPDRWASINHRDFAEVRPGGSTRPVQRAGSECASSAASAPVQLRVGAVQEVVVVIQISDAAERAIFRPEGTAGWVFDLPSLPRMAATPTTSPQAVAPTSVPSSSPSATTTAAMEEASVATAEA